VQQSLSNAVGVIDSGYRGQILFRYRDWFQSFFFWIRAGKYNYQSMSPERMRQKIAQYLASPTVSELTKTRLKEVVI